MGIYVPGSGMLFVGRYPGTRITRLRDRNSILKICEMIGISYAKYAVSVTILLLYTTEVSTK